MSIEEEATGQSLGPYAEKLKQHIFIAPSLDGFIEPLNAALNATPDALKTAGEGFRTNIRSVFLSAAVPAHLAIHAVLHRKFLTYLTAERIRAIDIHEFIKEPDSLTDNASEGSQEKGAEREAQATQVAKEKFAKRELTPSGLNRAAKEGLLDLAELLSGDDVATATKELLRQSVVLTWGALEALATDLFISALNEAPRLSFTLLEDEPAKKRFALKDFFRILENWGFDLSHHMGDILAAHCRLDDLPTIKALFNALLPDNEQLRAALSKDALWKLYQRRNLIVHRGATVDRIFLEKTGENLPIGSRLTVSSDELLNYLQVVRETGAEMISGFSSFFS